MKLQLTLCLLAFIVVISAWGQSPPGINYQGVARDTEGKPLVSRPISVRISILKESANGETEYAETHEVTTNSFGLFTLVIGQGEASTGSFQFVSWAVGNKWLQIELDPDGGNSFQLLGSQQLMSVPYAFYATYSGNGLTAGQGIKIQNNQIINTGDADNAAGNELISDVSFGTDKKLRITEAGVTKEADLSSLVGASQDLSNVLSIGNDAGGKKITNLAAPAGNTDAATKEYVDNHTDGDASAVNEIQDLALTGNMLSITNNASATAINLAPYLDNTDNQSLSLSGNNLSILNGNSVSLAGYLDNTDNQDLTLSGNMLSLVGDATPVNLTPYLDNTDNQDLTLTGNILSLTNDGTTVNLSGYLDNTDSQSLAIQMVDANTRSLSITGGNALNVDVRDADFSTTNEIQDLSRLGNTLSLSGDGTSVDLAPFMDNTDNQDLSLTGNTLSLVGDATPVNLAPYLQNLSLSSSGTNRTVSISGGTGITLDVADNDNSATNELQNLTLTAAGTNRTISISGGTGVTLNVADNDNDPANELQNLNQVLTAGADAGTRVISNLGSPTNNNDAVTKKYVDDADALLASRISTTYAFKTAFAYTNGTGGIVSDQQLPFTSEEFDDFNVLASNTFTATEDGVYVFVIDGTYLAGASGGQLNLLYNSVKYSVAIVQPWGAAFPRYNATFMFKLVAGQTVRLIGDNVFNGAQFQGVFFGYKL